ncbi:hypothetical protein BZA77DRAFT_367710 [Pyronema omphalodes]|nr:hypothetical protein BZA77DRAFT_367710 [Pyronema omphalodes]
MKCFAIALQLLIIELTINVNAVVLHDRDTSSSAIGAAFSQPNSTEWDPALTNSTNYGYPQLRKGVSEHGIVKRDNSKSDSALFRMLTGIASTVSRVAPEEDEEVDHLDYGEVYKVTFDKNGTAIDRHSHYDFEFKDYAPDVFEAIRSNFEVDENSYVQSLIGNMSMDELASPGRSGSTFFFSTDKKYAIKTIHEGEHKQLRKYLKKYLAYVASNPNTLLSRFFGLHRIKKWNGQKIYFVVMNNVFPPQHEIHQTWDLKGSTYRRLTSESKIAENPKKTQQDNNWRNKGMRLHLGPQKAELLLNQLRSDSDFLKKLRIVDYSLLVGIHRIGNESIATTPSKSIFNGDDGCFRSTNANDEPGDLLYCFGVIDILTYYTAWKAVENFCSSWGKPTNSISCIAPPTYARRFVEFIGDQIEPKPLGEPEQDTSDAETNFETNVGINGDSVDAIETSMNNTTPSSNNE